MKIKALKVSNLLFLTIAIIMVGCNVNKNEETVKRPLPVMDHIENNNALTKEKINPEIVWKLKAMRGIAASEIFDIIPTLKFDVAEPYFFGTSGCNRYNAVYDLKPSGFSVTQVRTTRMYCENINNENDFLENLKSTTSAEIIENVLIFKSGEEVVFEFISE